MRLTSRSVDQAILVMADISGLVINQALERRWTAAGGIRHDGEYVSWVRDDVERSR